MARVGDELIRPMLRALDDVPVHGRQLGDMLRGLRTTQRRNRDGVNEVDTYDGPATSSGRNDTHNRPATSQGRNDTDDGPATSSGHKDASATNPPIDRSRNPDWLNDLLDRTDLPAWRRRLAEGQQFNYQNHHRYPQNEVVLESGKRLDSYISGAEIVSRKHSDLSSVRPETAMSYIDEISQKYPAGAAIAGGEVLRGDPILEIPVPHPDSPIPPAIIAHANGAEPPVTIRDVLGNVYN
ncbi:hypothetical protein ACFQZV_09050 [Microbacterium koreense]|uniref:Uncharacterized protein n=1 Tax=Microbacterium koreense TaxID=323761 RepID=A0ABW2ZS18_9MICO